MRILSAKCYVMSTLGYPGLTREGTRELQWEDVRVCGRLR